MTIDWFEAGEKEMAIVSVEQDGVTQNAICSVFSTPDAPTTHCSSVHFQGVMKSSTRTSVVSGKIWCGVQIDAIMNGTWQR